MGVFSGKSKGNFFHSCELSLVTRIPPRVNLSPGQSQVIHRLSEWFIELVHEFVLIAVIRAANVIRWIARFFICTVEALALSRGHGSHYACNRCCSLCLIKSMIEWLISITCIFNDDMRNVGKNIKLNHPYSRTGGWKWSSFFLVSTDQANEWVCGEQHRRPDASQTLQNETRGRAAEPGRSECTGEDCLHFSETLKYTFIHWLWGIFFCYLATFWLANPRIHQLFLDFYRNHI